MASMELKTSEENGFSNLVNGEKMNRSLISKARITLPFFAERKGLVSEGQARVARNRDVA